MKYGRPVRELLAECITALPQPFTRTDVLRWFESNYPNIAPTTVSTHMAGLTSGNRPHPHLAQFPPVMERVGRGLYRRLVAGTAVRNLDRAPEVRPSSDLVQPGTPDEASSRLVVLIGCVRSKREAAASARDLYTSVLFRKRRRYAEQAGVPWYIVSGRLGLVHPDEVIAPYELYLPAMSRRYRQAWGSFVTAQLAEVEQLAELTVEIHAGDAYVETLRPPLTAAGAVVVDAVDATSFGGTLAWYDSARRKRQLRGRRRPP